MKSEPIENARWIDQCVIPRSPEEFKVSGCTIGHCIPSIYKSYCKIMHPLQICPDESDALEPLEKKQLLSVSADPEKGPSINILNQDGSISNILDFNYWEAERNKHFAKRWDFVSWKSIIDKYGLTYHNEIGEGTLIKYFENKSGWPKNLSLPYPRYLPRHILIKLLEFLKSISSIDQVCVYQTIPHSIHNDFELLSCSFIEVLEYFEEDFVGYLYPKDKSWIVFTDNDLNFTIIGGSDSLIDAINSSDLEVFKCKSTTRVDWKGDKLNI